MCCWPGLLIYLKLSVMLKQHMRHRGQNAITFTGEGCFYLENNPEVVHTDPIATLTNKQKFGRCMYDFAKCKKNHPPMSLENNCPLSL